MPKYVKRKGVYYVKSDNEVLMFDESGMFRNAISKVGNGPDEYPQLLDMDVVEKNDGAEVWIGSLDGIYRYKAVSSDFLGKIDVPFMSSQLKWVNDSSVLVTTPDNPVIKLIDSSGQVRKEFLEKDFANSGQSLVQYQTIGNKIVYQIDATNTAVVYDPISDEFSIENILPPFKGLLTPEDNRRSFKANGMNSIRIVRDSYTLLGAVRLHGGYVVVTSNWPGNLWKLTLGQCNGTVKTFTYAPKEKCQIENDCFDHNSLDSTFFATQTCCDSDDSFLFVLFSDSDDNPTLLNVYSTAKFD